MSKGKLWGIILFILIVLGFGIWLYTSSNVKKDVDKEGIEILDDMTIPAVNLIINTNLNFFIMAKETVNILKDKIDIVELLAQLNAALSEEWLAFYQYWVGSFVVEGAMRGDVQREFQEHAAEEYNHAKLLADRIIELEGVPVLDPKQWFDLARCKYDAPVDFGSEVLLKQNVESERCAIYRYQQIAEFTNGIDFTTCDIAKHIMAEEEDHEQDLQDYLNDIARMKAYILKK